MPSNLGIICFHGGTIVNTDNGIIYNGGSYKFLTSTLDISLNELSRILCEQLGKNIFGIEVKITWRMLQIRVSQACYIGVLIYSDRSVSSMFGFARINKINMLELYFNSRLGQGKSSSMKLTQFLNNSYRTTQISWVAGPFRLGDMQD